VVASPHKIRCGGCPLRELNNHRSPSLVTGTVGEFGTSSSSVSPGAVSCSASWRANACSSNQGYRGQNPHPSMPPVARGAFVHPNWRSERVGYLQLPGRGAGPLTKCPRTITGTSRIPSDVAARKRASPAMISPLVATRMGLTKPNSRIEAEIWATCPAECADVGVGGREPIHG
jgi:hypothetical protein